MGSRIGSSTAPVSLASGSQTFFLEASGSESVPLGLVSHTFFLQARAMLAFRTRELISPHFAPSEAWPRKGVSQCAEEARELKMGPRELG